MAQFVYTYNEFINLIINTLTQFAMTKLKSVHTKVFKLSTWKRKSNKKVKRTEQIHVRLTPYELLTMQQLAERSGMDLSEYVRNQTIWSSNAILRADLVQ